MTVEPRAFRDTLGRMPTGVTVITTTAPDGEMHGVTIGSFSSLSLEPPLVLFCLDKDANCRQAFLDSTHFAVNVLAEGPVGLVLDFCDQERTAPLGQPRIFHWRSERRSAHGGCGRADRMHHRIDP